MDAVPTDESCSEFRVESIFCDMTCLRCSANGVLRRQLQMNDTRNPREASSIARIKSPPLNGGLDAAPFGAANHWGWAFRICTRLILPLVVLGSRSTKATRRGML